MSGSCSESEDSYTREEREQFLYSQIYHDTADDTGYVNAYDVPGSVAPVPLPICSSQHLLEEKTTKTSRSTAGVKQQLHSLNVKSSKPSPQSITISSGEDNSDVEVVKEVVVVNTEDSDSTQRQHGEEDNIASSEEEEEEEVPLWARLNLGAHSTDSNLSVNMRTHGRQRNDSIVSHTSSVLGDDTDTLVTLTPADDEYATLEQVLDTLPDEGWEILPTDYKLTSSGKKRPRYHNLKCRNCDGLGHISDACPKPQKQKVCSLCSEVHPKQKRFCPHSLCTWCRETGHSTQKCAKQGALRSSYCQRCRMKGHKSTNCHELWRQWHATTHLPEGCIYPTVPKEAYHREVIYCSQCGYKGHSAHECKATPWWQVPMLSTHVQYYNTFGKESDFKRNWCPRTKSPKSSHRNAGLKDNKAHTSTSTAGDGSKPNRERKALKANKQGTNPTPKKKKLKPIPPMGNTDGANAISTTVTPKQGKRKPTKSQRIARKRLKIQLGITSAHVESGSTGNAVTGAEEEKQTLPLKRQTKKRKTSDEPIRYTHADTRLPLKRKKLGRVSPLATNFSGSSGGGGGGSGSHGGNTKSPVVTPKPGKVKPTKSQRKARKKLKEQLGIPVSESISSYVQRSAGTAEVVDPAVRKRKNNKKANERAAKRKLLAKLERKARRHPHQSQDGG